MKDHKEKKFLKLPKYPGGNEALKKFIANNLRYPEEALRLKVEGTVYLRYSVNSLGDVVEVEVLNGIGHGCDEEAVRVIRLLKYEKARNRGLRVTSSMRTQIHFKLPSQPAYSYEITRKSSKDPEKKDDHTGESGTTYSYTIRF